MYISKKEKRLNNVLTKSSKKYIYSSSFLVKLQAFCVKQKVSTMEISLKDFVQIIGKPFLQNIFHEMVGVKELLEIFFTETYK